MLECEETLVRKSFSKYQSKKQEDYLFPDTKIAIIIPAFNEEKNIEKVLLEIPENISDNLDIVVIDDGSEDKTLEIVKNLNLNLNLHVIKHEKNKGYGAAVRTGLAFVRENNHEIVVIVDGDGQHNPQYIPKLIEPIVNNEVDFVFGNRFHFNHHMTPLKLLCSKLISATYLVFLRRLIHDPTNGYRALSREVINYLELESDYSISQEMLLKVLPFYNYKQIPIHIERRENGSSFIRLKNYFYKMFFMILKYYFFPKIKRLTIKIFSQSIRRKVSHICLKT